MRGSRALSRSLLSAQRNALTSNKVGILSTHARSFASASPAANKDADVASRPTAAQVAATRLQQQNPGAVKERRVSEGSRREVSYEIGRLAQLADSAVVGRDAGTTILTTVVAAKPAPGPGGQQGGVAPMSVEFKERAFAVGAIPKTQHRREAAPREREILLSRTIDRALRTLLPNAMPIELQIVSTLLSLDEGDMEVLALNSASLALSLSSRAYWDGPFGAVRVCIVDDSLVINPDAAIRKDATLDLLYVGTASKAIMVEATANQVSPQHMKHALRAAASRVQDAIEHQEAVIARTNVAQWPSVATQTLAEGVSGLHGTFGPLATHLFDYRNGWDRAQRASATRMLAKEIQQYIKNNKAAHVNVHLTKMLMSELPDALFTRTFREFMIHAEDSPYDEEAENVATAAATTAAATAAANGSFGGTDTSATLPVRRVDKRGMRELREISSAVDVLPVVHGSAIFQRGRTQTLCSVTLGTTNEMEVSHPYAAKDLERKPFFLHYNFPPYSVNEIGRNGAPNRRMIGHGNLAEKALLPVLPPLHVFPYSVRVNSDITGSDGSSSMATVCGATLALMDAGVPITAPVAGISVGCVYLEDEYAVPGSGDYKLMVDILGDEDHHGCMDFKIAGTEAGITALQCDMKEGGLPLAVLLEATDVGRDAYVEILGKMTTTIDSPRASLKSGAMSVRTVPIKKHHLKSMMGPKGEHITKLEEDFDVQVAVDKEMLPEGFVAVNLYHQDQAQLDLAEQQVLQWTKELTPGTLYDAVVSDVRDFGAYVLIDGSHQAFVHVSEVQEVRLKDKDIHDVLSPGHGFKVLCLSSDERGIRVSRKAAFRHLGLDSTGKPVKLTGLALPSYEALEGNRRDASKKSTRKADPNSLALDDLDAAEVEGELGSPSTSLKSSVTKELPPLGGSNKKEVEEEVIHPAAVAAAQADTAAWEAANKAAVVASSPSPPSNHSTQSEDSSDSNVDSNWDKSQASHVVYTEGKPMASPARVDRQAYKRPAPRQIREQPVAAAAPNAPPASTAPTPTPTTPTRASRKPASIGEVTAAEEENVSRSKNKNTAAKTTKPTASAIDSPSSSAQAQSTSSVAWASKRDSSRQGRKAKKNAAVTSDGAVAGATTPEVGGGLRARSVPALRAKRPSTAEKGSATVEEKGMFMSMLSMFSSRKTK